ncbi:hypothetical protein PIB30_018064 [Stylosanthes scabra]|uniref:Transmembrane protein n=1 Tax=Stylosanthes scabra TaxID=79078 RepID=A0ABU6X8P1_9FABA|nr:hypothetical protein [Stylosanthes scabra]
MNIIGSKNKKRVTLEESDENEEKNSSNERVLECSNKNGEGDKQELPENLNTCPCQNPSQSKRKNVVRVRVKNGIPTQAENSSSFFAEILAIIFFSFFYSIGTTRLLILFVFHFPHGFVLLLLVVVRCKSQEPLRFRRVKREREKLLAAIKERGGCWDLDCD